MSCVFHSELTTGYMTYYTNTSVSKQIILCWNCNNPVTQYFSSVYNGQRGKCSSCDIDFPLE